MPDPFKPLGDSALITVADFDAFEPLGRDGISERFSARVLIYPYGNLLTIAGEQLLVSLIFG